MSHYETFEHYHSTFYKHVEALSVTPFSAGATARGLAALLVSLVRQPGFEFNSNDKAMLMATQRGHQYVKDAIEAITRRAELIAGVEAAEEVRQQLKRKMDLWQKRAQRTAQGNQLGYETKKDGVNVHANCTKPGKSPAVVPARFIVACKNGHFDDFPWRDFVHRGPTNCKGGLKLFELTATGEAAGIEVPCEGENCGASRRMSDAFKMDLNPLPVCRGRRPHLRDHDEAGCKAPNGQDMRMEPMLQGASNSWFGIMLSALAIPQASGELKQLVEDHWTVLEKVQSEQNIELLQQVTPQLRDLSEYTPSKIWQAVQAKKTAVPSESTDPTDLKTPEWDILTDPESAEKSCDFQLWVAAPPKTVKLRRSWGLEPTSV